MQWTTCVTGPLPTSWPEGESPVMRYILVASIVVLSVGCGHENPTAPTSTISPAPPVNPACRPSCFSSQIQWLNDALTRATIDFHNVAKLGCELFSC